MTRPPGALAGSHYMRSRLWSCRNWQLDWRMGEASMFGNLHKSILRASTVVRADSHQPSECVRRDGTCVTRIVTPAFAAYHHYRFVDFSGCYCSRTHKSYSSFRGGSDPRCKLRMEPKIHNYPSLDENVNKALREIFLKPKISDVESLWRK